MKAYVLIKIRPGAVKEVVKNLSNLNQVREAHMTFGQYDAVAVVEAENLSRIGSLISVEIQPIPGIRETLTCLAVEI
jgi:DNA-binding Lrp family transcriptional regulator